MKKIKFNLFLCVLLCIPLSGTFAQNFLTNQGNKLVDSKGNTVRLTGVNWFGFETNLKQPHGLWARDCKSMLKQIKDYGFNCIRFPFSNDILLPGATVKVNTFGTDPYTGVSPMNKIESTFTSPLQLLDQIVEYCQELNLKIILDNHSRISDNFLNEAVWYIEQVSEEKWIEDWVTLANRYKNNDAVIAMDLDNEPNGNYGKGSTWGNSNPLTDWNKAAERCGNAILKVNPNVLILVEGVQTYNGDSYWWGGNLKGAADFPVVLSNPKKLVYSPHEYGPEVFNSAWFSDPSFPSNMPAIWSAHFDYLYANNTAPLLIGEFGIKDPASFGGTEGKWFDTFLAYMGKRYSWTFWCWNPNSGDTGGILDNQWANPEQWKLDKLKPYMAPEIPNGSSPANHAPVAAFTANPLKGIAPLTVNFDASSSSDADGDALSFTWNFGDNTNGTGETASHIYAINGTYNVEVSVSDSRGATSSASAKIVVSSSDTIIDTPCDFETPLATALPSVNKTFNYVHVLGNGGPSLANIRNFTINWDLPNKGFYQLSVNTTNGTPNWYVDLRAAATHTLASPSPSITFKGTGFSGLDGSYYAAINGDNFVLVSQAGGFVLYFSNNATAPDCSGSTIKKALSSDVLENDNSVIYPNPFKDEITLKGDVSKITLVLVYDQVGKQVLSMNGEDIKGNSIKIGNSLPKGTYILKVFMDKESRNYKVLKQ